MFLIRRAQFLDFEAITALCADHGPEIGATLEQIRAWYGPVRLLSFFPNRYQHLFDVYVAQVEGKVVGLIQVSPLNATQTTWRINRLVVNPEFSSQQIGILLLGWVFEYYRNARTWVIEVGIHDKETLALCREKGFQSLAEHSLWYLAPHALAQITTQESSPVQLLPMSNADAGLVCELDTATMPPIIRNIYNRHLEDFRRNYLQRLTDGIGLLLTQQERVSRYIYEPQRKVAMGAFDLHLQRAANITQPHRVTLWVHPAYTWLYGPLMHALGQICRHYTHAGLIIASADYQPEREAYLESLGATINDRTLLMSRSVWPKVRESRNPLENLTIPDVLPRWRPAQNPVPNQVQHQEPDQPPPTQNF